MIFSKKELVVKSRLRSKLMILIIGICFIFALIMLIANQIYIIYAEDRALVYTQNNIDQISNYMQNVINQTKEVARLISQQSYTLALANDGGLPIYQKAKVLKDIKKQGTIYCILNSYIDSIYVYFEDAAILSTSNYGDYLKESIIDTSLYSTLYSEADKVNTIRIVHINKDFISKKDLISLIIPARFINSDIMGNAYVLVNLKEEMINDIVGNIKNYTNGIPAIVSLDDEVIYCDDNSLDRISFDFMPEKNGSYKNQVNFNGKTFYFFSSKEIGELFKMIFLSPEETLLSESYLMTFLLIIVFIMFIGAGLLIHVMYMRYIYHPLLSLVESMGQVEQGNFRSNELTFDSDEFGFLNEKFHSMVNCINEQMQEIQYQNELSHKMEIQALQKQIDPHFLYNTLDAVNWIAQRHDIKEISSIVINLSHMYHYIFNKGSMLISCKDAIQSSRCYLDIQTIRFQGKLSYIIDNDNRLDNYQILNLILQTAVENAIVHGFDNMRETGHIEIISRYLENENEMLFIVSDNGCGMDEEKLCLINKLLESNDLIACSGLTNVQRRIKLYYGDQYSIKISSRLNEGTEVAIRIPVQTQTELNENSFTQFVS